MARVNVEYVRVGDGTRVNGATAGVILEVVGSLAPIAVATTATVAGSRPVVPTGSGLMARVTALDGTVVVAWGTNPTATDAPANVAAGANMLRIPRDWIELIPVKAGELLSFIEAL